ncbi:MAG: nuclear transport factor 2 family protein [Cyclobacteriaceae bacterium]
MKYFFIVLVGFVMTYQAKAADSTGEDSLQDNRTAQLDRYWAALAKTAKEGDFDGMKALYHPDAVLVKPDTTIAISEAFKYRWKKEIMEVNQGKRANTLEFRFAKRIGNDITAFEKGIYHYTSIETSSGKTLGDSYTHFEILLVKRNGQWVALMEYQKAEATKEEWESLR